MSACVTQAALRCNSGQSTPSLSNAVISFYTASGPRYSCVEALSLHRLLLHLLALYLFCEESARRFE